jgi:anti-sigma B factor antagonist
MNDQLASIQTEQVDGRLVVRLSGEIDLSNSELIHRRIEETMSPASSMVIELTEVKYLDSQGLRVIKQLVDKSFRDGITLQIVAPEGTFSRQVLDLATMSEYVPISESLEA